MLQQLEYNYDENDDYQKFNHNDLLKYLGRPGDSPHYLSASLNSSPFTASGSKCVLFNTEFLFVTEQSITII
jgi:hypothetical protein